MYIRLPDYDDFQGYDLGADGILSQIAHGIYDNSHHPSWGTLKHHLLMAEIPKNIFKDPKAVAENDKRGDFEHERMFGSVTEIPIANTSNEFVEMGFLDYGDFATFLRIRGAFPRFSAIIVRGRKRRTNG